MAKRSALVLSAAVVLGSIALFSQTQQTPGVTFQVEVNFVDVDVVVTDEAGQFVTGLTRDDFEVFEDGKPQKVDTFGLVDIPVVRPTAAAELAVDGRTVRPDTQTNREPFDGRVYVFVLDDLDVSAMRSTQVRDSARQFVKEHMSANDLAAVVYTSGRTDAAQEFTTNRDLLIRAIDKFQGRRMRSLSLERLDDYYQRIAFGYNLQNNPDPGTGNVNQDQAGYGRTSDPTELERGTRALNVLDTLKNTADFLGSVRGRRKAVMFFSEGLDYPLRDVFAAHDATVIIRATQDVISTAARANVNLYSIDPRGLAGMTTDFMESAGLASAAGTPGPILLVPGTNTPVNGVTGASGGTFDVQNELMQEFRLSQDTLREFAEQTGGIAVVNTNNVAPAFARIVDANSRYYLLGYYPPNHPRNGRFHKIEVRVKRPGVRVEARRGYAEPRGRTPEERKRDEAAKLARDARRPDGRRTSTPLLGVLTSPMQQSGLAFSVSAAPFKTTTADASVALAIEIDGSRLQFGQPNEKGQVANKIELSFYGLNEQGKAISAGWSDLDLTLRPETRDRVTAHGVRVNPRINLPPGRYQVRVGARESVGGQMGSVFYDLDVPDFRKEKVMVGGLLLTTPSVQQTPSIQPDQIVSKLLPAPATSQREFPRNDLLALYTEIYDNDTSRQARHIDVTVRLVSDTGTNVIASRDDLVNGAAGEKPWEIFGFAKQIPLKELAPGRYLLRVEAAVRGSDAAPAARETLITVRN